MTGKGLFYNSDHLLDLREERRDGQEKRDDTNDAPLKSLVGELLGTDCRLILREKDTGAWMSVRDTRVSGKVFLGWNFMISYLHVTMLPPSISRSTVTDLALPSRYITHLSEEKEDWSSHVTMKCMMNYFNSPDRPSPHHQYALNP